MKALLHIGHRGYLFGSEKEAAACLLLLSKAVPCTDNRYGDKPHVEITGEMQVGIDVLPGKTVIKGGKGA